MAVHLLGTRTSLTELRTMSWVIGRADRVRLGAVVGGEGAERHARDPEAREDVSPVEAARHFGEGLGPRMALTSYSPPHKNDFGKSSKCLENVQPKFA